MFDILELALWRFGQYHSSDIKKWLLEVIISLCLMICNMTPIPPGLSQRVASPFSPETTHSRPDLPLS